MKLKSKSAPLPHFGGIAALTSSLVAPLIIRAWQSRGNAQRTSDPQTSDTTPASRIRWFESGETGVTFQDLFRSYLRGSSNITLVDPHVKSYRQIRILGEFLDSLTPVAQGEVILNLVTSTATESPEWAYGQVNALIKLQESAKARGIKLCVKFDETIHDRWIQTNEWTIMLGRGLDLWDAATCYNRTQEERPIAKKFAITYVNAK
jgi:ATP-dependent Lon protease